MAMPVIVMGDTPFICKEPLSLILNIYKVVTTNPSLAFCFTIQQIKSFFMGVHCTWGEENNTRKTNERRKGKSQLVSHGIHFQLILLELSDQHSMGSL